MPQGLGVCCYPAVLVHLSADIELVIDRPLLQLSFEFLAAIAEAPGHNMTALQHATRPRIAGIAVRTCKLALGMIEVLIQDVSVGLDRNSSILPFADRDAAFLPSADVVVGRIEPFVRVFVEPG